MLPRDRKLRAGLTSASHGRRAEKGTSATGGCHGHDPALPVVFVVAVMIMALVIAQVMAKNVTDRGFRMWASKRKLFTLSTASGSARLAQIMPTSTAPIMRCSWGGNRNRRT